MTDSRNPVTREEWQEAADFAEVLLTIDSARLYGLITGGPEVDLDRCRELLDRALELGISPRPDCIERVMPVLIGESARAEIEVRLREDGGAEDSI